MKKLSPFISIILLLATDLHAQEAMVAGWTFPGNTLTADTGVAVTPDMEIYTFGETSDIELKNGFETKAAQASGWNDGMEEKGWIVDLNTQGFSNLTISSRQQSGGNDPGPKYFKLQFSTDGGASWSDLESGNITVENDWETSFVDNRVLPQACDNLEELHLRWLMTSNEASGSGGNVMEAGKSKIDEIFIRGEVINTISEPFVFNNLLSLGKKRGTICIHSFDGVQSIVISTLNGQYLSFSPASAASEELQLPEAFLGRIIVCSILLKNGHKRISGKLFIP